LGGACAVRLTGDQKIHTWKKHNIICITHHSNTSPSSFTYTQGTLRLHIATPPTARNRMTWHPTFRLFLDQLTFQTITWLARFTF
jgi:hypothetical protein